MLPCLRKEAKVPGGGEAGPPIEGCAVCTPHNVSASTQERAFL